ncbi:MAG: tape measure protein [Melioribacteraceae bacterium]|nr:tape measure protein [Melioribacteraceae bacterium]
MADTITVRVKLDARSANTQLRNFQNQLNSVESGGKSVNKQIQRTNKSVERSINLLRLYAGAWIVVRGAMSALSEIGTVQNMERAISTVAGESANLSEKWNELRDISLRTRSDFETNVVLYQRLTFATRNLGATAEEVNKTLIATAAGLRLGGATGQEAASTIRQLSQAFSKGKLDGDEFRSVMENAGFLMVRFADQIGVTTGELIEMSRQGKLTSDVMLEGFGKVAEEMEQKLAASPRTVSDAINNLKTTWLDFLKSLEISGAAVSAIDLLTTSFNGLKEIVVAIREELVNAGLVETRTVEESVGKRIELTKELTAELKVLSDLERDRNRIIPLFRTTDEEVEAQQTRISNIAKELALETQKFNQLKTARQEQKKIADDAEKARATLAADAEKRRKALEAQKKAQDELNAARKFEQEATAMLRDAMAIEEADRKKAAAAAKEQADAIKKLQDEQFKLIQVGADMPQREKGPLERFSEDIIKAEDVMVNALKGMEDALVEFVQTGKLSFKDLADSIIADITRMIIRQQITAPLAGALGGAGAGSGNLISGAMAMFAGAQHGADFVVGGRGGIDNNLVAFRASKGERVTVTPEGKSMGNNITINITTQDAESFARNEDQIMNSLQTRLAIAQRNM